MSCWSDNKPQMEAVNSPFILCYCLGVMYLYVLTFFALVRKRHVYISDL